MAIALAAILCFLAGFLLVALGLPFRSALTLRISLSAGFGLAVFSIVYFLARLSGFLHLFAIDGALCLILLIVLLAFRQRRENNDLNPQRSAPHRFVAVAFGLSLLAALYSALVHALARPYGSGWDSFAIWNLHARFLFRAGPDWRAGFSPLTPWSHPDYPLLLPAAIAHFWTVLGRETPAVPTIIGLVFTFSTVALLFSGLDLLLNRTTALLGAMCLLSTPFFIDLGTWQYADVPLSFFILATLVLVHLHDQWLGSAIDRRSMLALAGLAAGFAAWTKNEGVLFLLAILLARIWRVSRQSSPPSGPLLRIAPLLLSIAPIFALIVFFKRAIAPPGDLFSDPATMLHKLADSSRYWAVLKWYAKEFVRFGEWWLIPIPILMLVLYYPMRRTLGSQQPETPVPDPRTTSTEQTETLHASAAALLLTLAGYFFIYLITPRDIYWHLRFSLSRLFLQLWPSAIFLFFLSVTSKPHPRPNPRSDSL